MSNRDMCISIINNMEEWELQSALEILRFVKGAAEGSETGALETWELLSIPGMREKLMEGKKTPLSDCVPESEVDW